MKSKTLISKQLKRKTNSKLVDTIIEAKKRPGWIAIADILAGPRKNHRNRNLEEINKNSKEKDIVAIPGKVLSQGQIDKKIKIVALEFSKNAREKLKTAGCEVSYISEELKKNPEAKGVKILK